MSCLRVQGAQRLPYIETVWGLYRNTYRNVGLHLRSENELLKYARWDVCLEDGEVVRFILWKTTSFGMKLALAGHNGSAEAKHDSVQALRRVFHKKGVYGEVSHKVKDIVLGAGAPVVCAALAGPVLGKQVTPVGEIEYRRSLGAVGVVTKVLVGRPQGVPTTTADDPHCPLLRPRSGSDALPVLDEDFGSHLMCLAFEELEVASPSAVAAVWLAGR